MAKSDWELVHKVVIIVGIVTALVSCGKVYHFLREEQWTPNSAKTAAIAAAALQFGLVYGIFWLIRWIAKGYRAIVQKKKKPKDEQDNK